jgi:hypothetical protein
VNPVSRFLIRLDRRPATDEKVWLKAPAVRSARETAGSRLGVR